MSLPTASGLLSVLASMKCLGWAARQLPAIAVGSRLAIGRVNAFWFSKVGCTFTRAIPGPARGCLDSPCPQTRRAFGVVLATNAAGGIHQRLGPGSLMAVHDHFRWHGPRPWLQPGPGALGPPRPSHYPPHLLRILLESGRAACGELFSGTYASLTGPCYETPAEIRALRTWGADAVGMSTAYEVETAAGLGMECAALSCITNKAAGLGDGRLDHQEVLATAARQTDRVAEIVEVFLKCRVAI